MKKLFYSLAIFVSACSTSPYAEVRLDDFKIDQSALADGALVQALSFSGTPDRNPSFDYYVHFIVRDLATGDTVNVLTFNPTQMLAQDDRQLHFISKDNALYKHMVEDIGGNASQDVERVKLDGNFLSDVRNEYPTVIGMFGNVMRNE